MSDKVILVTDAAGLCRSVRELQNEPNLTPVRAAKSRDEKRNGRRRFRRRPHVRLVAAQTLLDVAEIGREGQLGDKGCTAPVGAKAARIQVGDVRLVER
jgi:hypothetical protein